MHFKNTFQNKTSRHIKSITELKEGMEIVISANTRRKNHAVVTNVRLQNNTFEIIHLSDGINSESKTDCQKLLIKYDRQLSPYFTYDYGDRSIERKLDAGGIIIKLRANILYQIFHTIKDLKYNDTQFNCDHFASYCITGSAYSKQYNTHNEQATKTLDTK